MRYQDGRFRVGPESAGAVPGPVCYRCNGKLAVTDINLCLSKIQADFFPSIFGPEQNQPLDKARSIQAFSDIAKNINDGRCAEDVAEGFLAIAIQHMAQAIKKISVARGYDVSHYVLNCFGGAGGQHACLVAEKLGTKTVFLHSYSGILSAYGMGLVDIKVERQKVANSLIQKGDVQAIDSAIEQLKQANLTDLNSQGLCTKQISHHCTALLKYLNTDTSLNISLDTFAAMQQRFTEQHQQQFGFSGTASSGTAFSGAAFSGTAFSGAAFSGAAFSGAAFSGAASSGTASGSSDKTIEIDTLIVESYGGAEQVTEAEQTLVCDSPMEIQTVRQIYSQGEWLDAPVIQLSTLKFGHELLGPAIIVEATGTSAQQNNNLNAPKAITQAAVMYVFRCLVNDDVPLNAGCMQALELIVPEGSLLNPRFPAAVVAGNVETSQAVTNALFAALGVLGSSQGTMNNLTFGNEHYQYYKTICSGSPAGLDLAGNGFNGVAAVHTHMTNTRMTDPEVLEQRCPVMLKEFKIDRDSGGKGKWSAGDGITRSITFLEDMQCSILSGHRIDPPYGLKGGEAGRVGRNWLTHASGEQRELAGCDFTEVVAGDSISIQSPTGGGFGKADK